MAAMEEKSLATLTANSEETVIYPSKGKMVFFLLVSLGFTGMGAVFLSLEPSSIASNFRRYDSPLLVYILAAAAVAFFGPATLYFIKKLFDQTSALILSREGIMDNASGVGAGFIPWAEITDIREYRVQKKKFISIHVKDPEKYVKRGHLLKRLANRANWKMTGTPVNIPANSLKTGYEELFSSIEQYFQDRTSDQVR